MSSPIDRVYYGTLSIIFDEFSVKERISFRLVNRRWDETINETNVWRNRLMQYIQYLENVYSVNVSSIYIKQDDGETRREILRFAAERDRLERGLELGKSRASCTTKMARGNAVKDMELSPCGTWLLTRMRKTATTGRALIVWRREGLRMLAELALGREGGGFLNWSWNQADNSLNVVIYTTDIGSAIAYKLSLSDQTSFKPVRRVKGINHNAWTLINTSAMVVMSLADADQEISCARYSLIERHAPHVKFRLENGINASLRDWKTKTAFLNSGHLVLLSNSGYIVWDLGHIDQNGIVVPTRNPWPMAKFIELRKIQSGSIGSQISCDVDTANGERIYREVTFRRQGEDGIWEHWHSDIRVSEQAEENPQGRNIAGKKICGRLLLQPSDDPDEIRFRMAVCVVPADGDGTEAQVVQGWRSSKIKVDFDAASGVCVALKKRPFGEDPDFTSTHIVH